MVMFLRFRSQYISCYSILCVLNIDLQLNLMILVKLLRTFLGLKTNRDKDSIQRFRYVFSTTLWDNNSILIMDLKIDIDCI